MPAHVNAPNAVQPLQQNSEALGRNALGDGALAMAWTCIDLAMNEVRKGFNSQDAGVFFSRKMTQFLYPTFRKPGLSGAMSIQSKGLF